MNECEAVEVLRKYDSGAELSVKEEGRKEGRKE